ncbi:MAG: PduL/EutD family phosphate acyltransferase [Candidatus Nanogingivalis sp.]
MSKETRNTTLDTIKLICAIMVVFIHTNLYASIDMGNGVNNIIMSLLWQLSNVAVPIFFMITGFYIYKNDKEFSGSKVLSQIYKLSNLFFLSIFLYIFFDIWMLGGYSINKQGLFLEVNNLSVVRVVDMIIWQSPIGQWGGALWFILSSIVVLFIYYINRKYFKKDGLILAIAAVLYWMFNVIYPLYGSNSLDIFYTRNAYCVGLFYIFIGVTLAKNKEKIRKLSTKTMLIYIFFVYTVMVLYQILKIGNISNILTPVLSILIFICAINNPVLPKTKFLAKIGGSLAVYLYIIHVIALRLYEFFYKAFFGDFPIIDTIPKLICQWIFAILTSCLVGFLYIGLKKKLTLFYRFKKTPKIKVEVSARHMHITKEAFHRLYGPKATLGVIRELSQTGEFLSDKKVSIRGEKGVIEDVSIIGPFREKCQIEVSSTDAYTLGVSSEVRLSGDLTGTSGCEVYNKKKKIELAEGLIISAPHIHMSDKFAEKYGYTDGDIVSFVVDQGTRPKTFHGVIIRVSENFNQAIHIDQDEANSLSIYKGKDVFVKIKLEL